MLEQVFRCSIKHLDAERFLLRQYFRDFVRDFVIFGDLLHSAFWNYAELVEHGVLLLYGGDTKKEESLMDTGDIQAFSSEQPFSTSNAHAYFCAFFVFLIILVRSTKLGF